MRSGKPSSSKTGSAPTAQSRARPSRAPRPDGYTLLWAVQPPLTIFPAMTKVPYDPQKDFAPISVVGTNPFVLVVNKDIPAKTVAGVRRLGEAAAGQAQLCRGQRRQPHASGDGAVPQTRRTGDDQRQLSRQRAGADRRHRRPSADDVLQPVRRAAARPSRRDPHARGVERSARAAGAGCADRRRVRLSRLQGRDLERPDGAGRHAQADRRQDRGRGRQGLEGSGIRRAS